MGLLPAICRGGDRWWLPLSAESTEAIGLMLLSAQRHREDTQDINRARILRALQNDPPLLIYAALHWSAEEASLDDLCDWLTEHVAGHFASGDAFIGAPLIDESVRRKWSKQRDYFRTVPIENWLAEASLWLEQIGPRVPEAWKKNWPTIIVDYEATESETQFASGLMLQQLARKMQRLSSLETSFDRRLQKAKLGAIKQFAYGLSHEINNPLANISTRAQQLQRDESDDTRTAILERIVEQVYRAHDMITDLMFFANPPAAKVQSCDLNHIVTQVAADFAEETQRQAIRLELNLPDDQSTASADPKMIGEALRALLRNSIDAIGCEGTIVVSLEATHGRYAIHVADSGPGLSPYAKQHAFDPYFSGREAGRGLGLGLCRAYRIAKLHGGEVTLAGGPTGCVATIIIAKQ